MTDVSTLVDALRKGDLRSLARSISLVEAGGDAADAVMSAVPRAPSRADIIGITGAPGAGKSSLLDRLIDVYKQRESRVGIVAIDPSSSVHGGAVLGDRVRWMRHATSPNVIIRSMASRGSLGGVNAVTSRVVDLLAAAGCGPIFVETVGVGQIGSDVTSVAGVVVSVTAPGLGDDIQMMKAGTLDVADVVVLTKADMPGAAALHSVMAAELEHRGGKLIQTSSLHGRGIDELVAEIDRLRSERRAHGATGRQNGNRSLLEAEIVERSLALLRPQLLARVGEMKLDQPPEVLARQLAARCGGAVTSGKESCA